MELHLGAGRFDVTHRAVVIAILGDDADAAPAGADAVEPPGAPRVPVVVPVCVEVLSSVDLAVALEAGAAGVRVPAAVLGPDELASCAAAGVTVFAVGDGDAVREVARAAAPVGVAAERLVLDVAADLRAGHDLAAAGALVCVSTDELATMSLALMGGCRVLRTREPRVARRVADVIAAVSEAAA